MNYEITLVAAFQYQKSESQFRNSPYSGFKAYPVLISLILFDQGLLNIIVVIFTLILSALLKEKYAIMMRIIMLFPQYCLPEWLGLVTACITNQIYVRYWPLQLLFSLFTVRSINGFFVMLFYGAVCRSVEIQKRKLFRRISSSQFKERQHSRIFTVIPHTLMVIDENIKIQYCNNKEFQFSEEGLRIVNGAIRKNQQSILRIDRVEYQFKQFKEQYKLVQIQFPCGDIALFKQLDQSIDTLYNQLCQDYQKWNNLRACKVVKESDLSNLASCTTDCRLLMHQMETMNNLINDLNFQNYCPEKSKFYMKNYVINLVESMINKLQDHFELINLYFETGIPEYVIGDKDIILYNLYTFLLSTTLGETKLEKLDIAVRIASVNNDKSGYDLEFQISFPCTPKQIRFYSHNEFCNSNEQLIGCMVNKCKSDFLVDFKIDSENLIILYTTNISWQVKEESASIENIQMADLNFTKNIVDADHFSWKGKNLLEKSNRSPLIRTAFKLSFSEQIATLQQHLKQNQFSNSNVATVVNSAEVSLENTQIPKQELQHYSLQFPEIQEEIMQLVKETLLEAYHQGLIDHDTLSIDLTNDDKNSQVYAESVQEPNDSIFQQQDELLFTTPQTKPRELKILEETRRQRKIIKLQRSQKETMKLKKTSNEKQLNLLFSPSVMSKFSNNLVMLSHTLYWKQSFKLTDSKTILTNQKFQPYILENRRNQQPIKWSHKINLSQMPKYCSQLLCLIPNTQYISAARRYGNSLYGDIQVFEPIITYDTTELIKKYKEYFAAQQQFLFILIYIHKQQTILELSQAIKSNESQWMRNSKFKQTTLIGLYNQTQLNKNLYQYLKYTIPLNQDDEQLRKSKEWIASICK